MSEADAVKRSIDGPVTREWLARDLKALGVREGMLLMVHSSLSGLGWVIGGPQTVIDALRDAVGPTGTLLMPAFTGSNGEPSYWRHPPVPESWWETIRNETPPFNPRTAPVRQMGVVPVCFMLQPDVVRSNHPQTSWLAQGPRAESAAVHALDSSQGDNSPLGYCYRENGYVLSLATRRTTILHLAEYRVDYSGKDYRHLGSAVMVDGRRQWLRFTDIEGDDEDFEQIRQEYMQAQPTGPDTWRAGRVCYGESRLFRIKPLVDFAANWIHRNRHGSV